MSNKPEWMPDDVWTWIQGKVRERDQVPTIDRMFRHARDIHECALRCLELREGHGFLFKPSLVLLAFVVEIYLKGLVAMERKDPRSGGHVLSKIYDSLDADTQAMIADRYWQRHDQRNLTDDLPAYSNLFVMLRYAYELEGSHETDMSGVAQLASSLYETWIELQPAYIQEGIVHDRITAPNQGIPII